MVDGRSQGGLTGERTLQTFEAPGFCPGGRTQVAAVPIDEPDAFVSIDENIPDVEIGVMGADIVETSDDPPDFTPYRPGWITQRDLRERPRPVNPLSEDVGGISEPASLGPGS